MKAGWGVEGERGERDEGRKEGRKKERRKEGKKEGGREERKEWTNEWIKLHKTILQFLFLFHCSLLTITLSIQTLPPYSNLPIIPCEKLLCPILYYYSTSRALLPVLNSAFTVASFIPCLLSLFLPHLSLCLIPPTPSPRPDLPHANQCHAFISFTAHWTRHFSFNVLFSEQSPDLNPDPRYFFSPASPTHPWNFNTLLDLAQMPPCAPTFLPHLINVLFLLHFSASFC